MQPQNLNPTPRSSIASELGLEIPVRQHVSFEGTARSWVGPGWSVSNGLYVARLFPLLFGCSDLNNFFHRTRQRRQTSDRHCVHPSLQLRWRRLKARNRPQWSSIARPLRPWWARRSNLPHLLPLFVKDMRQPLPPQRKG